MLEFDLLIFSFGQFPLALMTWVPMFLSTLLLPYQTLRLWTRPRTGGAWMLGASLGCVLLVAHAVVLCVLPVHVSVTHELPPASRCVLVFEQVRPRDSETGSTENRQGYSVDKGGAGWVWLLGSTVTLWLGVGRWDEDCPVSFYPLSQFCLC